MSLCWPFSFNLLVKGRDLTTKPDFSAASAHYPQPSLSLFCRSTCQTWSSKHSACSKSALSCPASNHLRKKFCAPSTIQDAVILDILQKPMRAIVTVVVDCILRSSAQSYLKRTELFEKLFFPYQIKLKHQMMFDS